MYGEAVSCYDMAIKLGRTSTGTYNNKAVALAETKRYEDAIACYDITIKMDGGSAKTHIRKD